MHLAYADDSGTGDKHAKFKVLALVLVEDHKFKLIEVALGALAFNALPRPKQKQFQEFKAWELYQGCNIWDGVLQKTRFEVIQTALRRVQSEKLPIIYGAVDNPKLRKTVYSSANPLDICFQFCAKAADEWMNRNQHGDLALIIADDCDKHLKRSMRESFRQLRQRLRNIIPMPGEAWHLHDEMYFGNSVDSIGIQIADLCAYFVRKHLDGDPAVEGFYNIIKECIVDCKIEPSAEGEWNGRSKRSSEESGQNTKA